MLLFCPEVIAQHLNELVLKVQYGGSTYAAFEPRAITVNVYGNSKVSELRKRKYGVLQRGNLQVEWCPVARASSDRGDRFYPFGVKAGEAKKDMNGQKMTFGSVGGA